MDMCSKMSLVVIVVLFMGCVSANEYDRNIFSSSHLLKYSPPSHERSNKMIVNCLNKPDNIGKFLINTYYADTTQVPMWREQPLRGTCRPGGMYVFDLKERVGYAWVKGETIQRAHIKVTSQQIVDGKYMHETWFYKENKVVTVSTSVSDLGERIRYPGFPDVTRCDGKDGRDKSGFCELAPKREEFNTEVLYNGVVQDIKLNASSISSAFSHLWPTGLSQGGKIHKKYWDYRNMKWNSDDCYTLEAVFADDHSSDHSFEVTCPVKDFKSLSEAKAKAEMMLRALGKIPRYARSWLKTIAINGGGKGSRAGANASRKSMTLNLAGWIIRLAYKLFLHEGAHVGLLGVQNSVKWKTAQNLDPTFISNYARDSFKSEDVAETYVAWMKVAREPDSPQSKLIRRSIPNRLAVLDEMICGKYYRECNIKQLNY